MSERGKPVLLRRSVWPERFDNVLPSGNWTFRYGNGYPQLVYFELCCYDPLFQGFGCSQDLWKHFFCALPCCGHRPFMVMTAAQPTEIFTDLDDYCPRCNEREITDDGT